MNKWALYAIMGLVIVALFGGLFYAALEKRAASLPDDTTAEGEVIGGDKDDHGCLVGAGYSWCEARQACIRSWEEYCTATAPKTAFFTCDEAKTIEATFYPGDDAFVDLVLSDERKMSIPRAMSGSGARYAKADESFVFWNKGDTAFVEENGTRTFSACAVEQ